MTHHPVPAHKQSAALHEGIRIGETRMALLVLDSIPREEDEPSTKEMWYALVRIKEIARARLY